MPTRLLAPLFALLVLAACRTTAPALPYARAAGAVGAADLAGTRWIVTHVEGAPVLPRTEPTLDGQPVPAGARRWLEFVDARVYRTREGCRRTQGRYVVTGERFDLTWQDADESACRTPEASFEDQRRMAVLQHVVQHGLAGGRLHVIGRNGRRAVFEPCTACAVGTLP